MESDLVRKADIANTLASLALDGGDMRTLSVIAIRFGLMDQFVAEIDRWKSRVNSAPLLVDNGKNHD